MKKEKREKCTMKEEEKMKHMKKLFGLLLAVVMVFAMSVSVFADAKVTV